MLKKSIKDLRTNIFSRSALIVLSTLFAGFVFSQASYAKDYMVEVLVFENINPSVSTESSQYTDPKESKSGSSTWILEPSMLLEEATRITNSPNYNLLHHFSWGQESLPYAKSANYSVIEQEIRGWIKVYAEQLLFVNIDVDYSGYRMAEKRRLKLNERHFFDHPKFGLLIQVSRLAKDKTDEQ